MPHPSGPGSKGPYADVEGILNAEGGEAILDAIERGETLLAMSKRLKVSRRGILHWLDRYGLKDEYLNARRSAAEAFDQMALDVLEAAKGKSKEEVQRANAMAHHYRWRSKSFDPSVYGDRTEVKLTTEIQDLSDEELERRYHALQAALAKGEPL